MLDLANEMSRPINGAVKGAPPLSANDRVQLTTEEIPKQGWRLLNEDLPFPAAVIQVSALRNNLEWMQRYAAEHGALLAPHGKTTMAPQLFDLQLRHGAWGITISTLQQLRVCRQFGVQQIFMANQLVGRSDIEYVSRELLRDPKFQFHCLVDSIEGVRRLVEFSEPNPANPINVLIEVGLPNGRCGCRSLRQAVAIADAVAASAELRLCGVECYEGLVVTDIPRNDLRDINALFELVKAVYDHCRIRRRFDAGHYPILSAGGSAYFDVAARALAKISGGEAKVLLRCGCYITHDSLFYQRLAQRFNERSARQNDSILGLQPALEVWGQVQSVPEPGLAIVNVGKRDISHDLELPTVRLSHRLSSSKAPTKVNRTWRVKALNDQHSHLTVPKNADIAVGDLIAFGVSHPCTTFDKWQLIWLVDNSYRVEGAVWTHF